MKSVFFFVALALLGLSSSAQNLHKGSLIGLHTSPQTLNNGVTMEQFTTFFATKVKPAYDAAFPGMKMFLVQSLRGQDSATVGIIYLFDNEAGRNKYFGKDGQPTALFNKSAAKVDAISKEMDKYVTSASGAGVYNDWLVK
jgi:hypothetical protein